MFIKSMRTCSGCRSHSPMPAAYVLRVASSRSCNVLPGGCWLGGCHKVMSGGRASPPAPPPTPAPAPATVATDEERGEAPGERVGTGGGHAAPALPLRDPRRAPACSVCCSRWPGWYDSVAAMGFASAPHPPCCCCCCFDGLLALLTALRVEAGGADGAEVRACEPDHAAPPAGWLPALLVPLGRQPVVVVLGLPHADRSCSEIPRIRWNLVVWPLAPVPGRSPCIWAASWAVVAKAVSGRDGPPAKPQERGEPVPEPLAWGLLGYAGGVAAGLVG